MMPIAPETPFRNLLATLIHEKFGLDEALLEEVLVYAESQGIHYGEALLKRRVLSESKFLTVLAEVYAMELVDTVDITGMKGEFTEFIPIQFLKKHYMVPLIPEDGNGPVRLAVNDPCALQAADDLARRLSCGPLAKVIAPRSRILSAINTFYDMSRGSAQDLVQDMEESGSDILADMEETADLLDDTSDSQLIRLVNHIISQSIKARASDIHIEPYQDSFKIRYRVDGILYDLLTPPRWIQTALVSRIKVMAKLNIAEKRLPQDGRIDVRIGEHDVDIRVSTVPTTHGERVVMRLLNKSGSLLTLSEFGMSDSTYATIGRLIQNPNGIILVTGPTGSGKTTSLYAIISAINSPDKNIITIEDPVEYQLKGIGQIQVNRKIDLTFALGLRSIVRQDPDVILVGEIRDRETAEIAVQSALTGHLVFSTLHTNDSASAVTRLVDIGIEPFLLSSAIKAVIAQRLVRKLCPQCKEPYHPDPDLLRRAGINAERSHGGNFYRAVGCEACFQTGYKGRMAIFEIMEVDEHLKGVMVKTSDANLIKGEAVHQGMATLRDDGIDKALHGLTTIEEVLRVSHD
ncbi:type II secretion system ATPase GspE [Desulfoluna sp.]|uniref:type II secretion system ATPase GspE n=1 Tax=Desulfoluna sp. TaxID=2045199 RepID=UPI002619CD95|nr:type II secretion system ATPase GspE [Desulfoluna sp.]